jgi:gallate decarboxylase subunit D
MYTTFHISIGEGSLRLESTIIKTQDGINIFIGGGERIHVGTTVISQPRPSLTGDGSTSCTTSVINLLGHKDDEIAIPVAEEICKHFKETTVVTAGIHIDNATAQYIEELKSNRMQITSMIIEAIEGCR